MNPQEEVAIILSTYNGEQFLREQMESFFTQTAGSWKLFVRDDMSKDNTLKILQEYKTNYPGKIDILSDEFGNIGAKKSYGELLNRVKSFSYVAFADQDDVWHSEKLEILLKEIKKIKEPGNIPAAVFSDLEIVDEKLNLISKSFFEFTKLSPKIVDSNVLIFRNVVPGCSMMINKSLNELIETVPDEAVMHDYWIVLAARFLGKISYVNSSLVKYRQHGKNALGAEKRSDKKMISIIKLFLLAARKKIFYLQDFMVYIKQLSAFYKIYEDKINDSEAIRAVINLPAQKSFLKRKMVAVKYGLGYGNWLMNLEFILCC